MAFGTNLRAERLRRKLTQQALAERVGVSTAAIAQYELGVKSPSIITAERIASALGVTIDALLHGRKG